TGLAAGNQVCRWHPEDHSMVPGQQGVVADHYFWRIPELLRENVCKSLRCEMRVFVTGAGGQLGHDVMNNLHARGYDGIGSDIAPVYSGIADHSAVTTMP